METLKLDLCALGLQMMLLLLWFIALHFEFKADTNDSHQRARSFNGQLVSYTHQACCGGCWSITCSLNRIDGGLIYRQLTALWFINFLMEFCGLSLMNVTDLLLVSKTTFIGELLSQNNDLHTLLTCKLLIFHVCIDSIVMWPPIRDFQRFSFWKSPNLACNYFHYLSVSTQIFVHLSVSQKSALLFKLKYTQVLCQL